MNSSYNTWWNFSVAIEIFFLVETFGLTTPDYYFYLNQSGCYDVDGVNDVQEYQDTRVILCLCSLVKPSKWIVSNLFLHVLPGIQS